MTKRYIHFESTRLDGGVDKEVIEVKECWDCPMSKWKMDGECTILKRNKVAYKVPRFGLFTECPLSKKR